MAAFDPNTYAWVARPTPIQSWVPAQVPRPLPTYEGRFDYVPAPPPPPPPPPRPWHQAITWDDAAPALNEEDIRSLFEYGHLDIPSQVHPGCYYRITGRSGSQVSVRDGERDDVEVERLCVQPVQVLIAPRWVALEKLLILSNERRYLRLANHFPMGDLYREDLAREEACPTVLDAEPYAHGDWWRERDRRGRFVSFQRASFARARRDRQEREAYVIAHREAERQRQERENEERATQARERLEAIRRREEAARYAHVREDVVPVVDEWMQSETARLVEQEMRRREVMAARIAERELAEERWRFHFGPEHILAT